MSLNQYIDSTIVFFKHLDSFILSVILCKTVITSCQVFTIYFSFKLVILSFWYRIDKGGCRAWDTVCLLSQGHLVPLLNSMFYILSIFHCLGGGGSSWLVHVDFWPHEEHIYMYLQCMHIHSINPWKWFFGIECHVALDRNPGSG